MITSLSKAPPTRSVRALMEKVEREEVGQRIKDLRDNSEETNRSMAEHCDVDTRTAAGWVAGDGISVKNLKKLAMLFGVTYEYLRYGHKAGETPDPFATGEALPYKAADVERSIRIEAKLDALLSAAGVDYLDETAPKGRQLTDDPLTDAPQAADPLVEDGPDRTSRRPASESS